MSASIRIPNFDPVNIKETTLLDADVAKGALSITPKSIQGMANNDIMYVSKLGSEICEMVSLTINGSNLTVTPALTFDHKKYAYLTTVQGNQIVVYRAANVNGYVPADTSFAALPDGLLDIDPDQMATDYFDIDGGPDYWYKFTYRNSTSQAETSLADAVPVRGGGYGHYASIDQVRRAAGFGNNANITDGMIDEKRIAAEDEINTQLGGQYAIPFADPVPATINNITRLLAAGYLLTDDGGPFSAPLQTEGEGKLKRAQQLLDNIKTGKITLQDATGLSIKQTANVNISPNLTSEEDDFMFKIDMEM